MLKEFKNAFLLGFRRQVWVVERLSVERGDNAEWETVGTIVGANDANSATARARSSWADLQGESEARLRAVAWSMASVEQREAAGYEDNLREREAGIRQRERDVISDLASMSLAMRRPEATASEPPQLDDTVILRTGVRAQVSMMITQSRRGYVVELKNGLLAEVERNPERSSPVWWRELGDENAREHR